MYGNKIVKHLENIIFKKWGNLHPDVNNKEYKQQFINAIKTVKNSPQFYLGNYEKMTPHITKFFENDPEKLFMGPSSKNLQLPYPSFLLCYDVPFESEHDKKIFKEKYNFPYDYQPAAVIVQKVSESVLSIQEMLFHFKNHHWFVVPGIKYFTCNKNIRETNFYKNNEDHPYESYEWDVGYNWFFGSPVRAEIQDAFLGIQPAAVSMIIYGVANLFLIAANSKHMTTETIYKLKPSKKKRKNINNNLSTFKILKLEGMPSTSKRYRYDKKDRENKGFMPENWCMGHPKVYTEEGGGLFGKYYGRWWWPDHPRGSKKQGTITKDYCIKNLKI